jgi:proline iminopeptidase
MRARIRDTEIFFDVDGVSLVPDRASMRERPTAFMVHGGPGVDHSGMKVRHGSLARCMQLVYFDHRGQGRSARHNREKYTLDENVEDMEALRRHLGFGPIVSLGTSYGGIVAMAHAARYPQAVSHLILIATVAHSGYVTRAKELVGQRGTADQIAMCDDLFGGRIDSEAAMRRFFAVMGSLYARKVDPAVAGEGLDRTIYSPQALSQAHGPDGFLRSFDLRSQLGSITAKTLIIAGRHDWISAPEFSQEIHERIKGSDVRIFEQSSHMVAADEPQQLHDVIAGFIVYNDRGSCS